MNLKTKKIIAREFLFLITVLVLGLIAFLCTYPYNSYWKNKIEILSNKINDNERIYSEKYSVENNQCSKNLKTLYDNLVLENYDLSDFETFERKMSDSVKRKILYTRLIEDGYELPDFETFSKDMGVSINGRPPFKPVGINPSIQNSLKDEINLLKTQKDEKSNLVLNFDEQTVFGINSFIVLAVLLFGLRYLFYAIKWSIKILYHKS